MHYRALPLGLFRSVGAWYDDAPQWPVEDTVDDVRSWISSAWAVLPLRDAISLASPALAERADMIASSPSRVSPDETRRIALSTARYLLRGRRPTPFGLFAGAGPVHFGIGVHLPRRPELVLQSDAVWMGALIERLESEPDFLGRLHLVANDTVAARGERLVVTAAPPFTGSHQGAVSVRRSGEVEAVLRLSEKPVPHSELIEAVVRRFPHHSNKAIRRWVGQLVACGLLISSLRPPATCHDTIGHVVSILDRSGTDDLQQTGVLRSEVERIADGLNDGRPTEELRSRMRSISDRAQQPIMGTLRFEEAEVPAIVAEEAAAAADALWRASPGRARDPGLRSYRDRFVARFGIGTAVPLSVVVDPTRGLGIPEHYGDGKARERSQRQSALMEWAQQAALDGARELTVDDGMLDRLADDTDLPDLPPPHMEVCSEVHADTEQSIAEGAFRLLVRGLTPVLAMSGRFMDVIGDVGRGRLVDQYRSLAGMVEGSAPVQVSFTPRALHLENVTRVNRLLPQVLGVGEHHRQPELVLDDLAIMADNDRLFVVCLSQGRVVEPVVAHAASRRSWPPVVRLLWEIARSGHARVSPWSWGLAATMPFLPRIRHGRSILSLARWRIPNRCLLDARARESDWQHRLDRWRVDQEWPRWVSIGEQDRRLRVCLDEPMDRAVLIDELRRACRHGRDVDVEEAPADHGWTDGRAHEVITTVASPSPPVPPPLTLTAHAIPRVWSGDDGMLPGHGSVLSAHLAGHASHIDGIVTTQLGRLLTALDAPPWWFVRYRHPGEHLRLRLQTDEPARVLPELGEWAHDLRRRGLIGGLSLETYRPETARYGSGAAQTAAQAVFAADSDAARTQIALTRATPELDSRALTAASMVDLAMALAPHPDDAHRMLLDLPGQGTALPRAAMRQAIRLTKNPADFTPAFQGGRVSQAWRNRAQACAVYSRTLSEDASAPALKDVLRSLLHMHHNRAVGVDAEGEAIITRMARSLALAHRAQEREQ